MRKLSPQEMCGLPRVSLMLRARGTVSDFRSFSPSCVLLSAPCLPVGICHRPVYLCQGGWRWYFSAPGPATLTTSPLPIGVLIPPLVWVALRFPNWCPSPCEGLSETWLGPQPSLVLNPAVSPPAPITRTPYLGLRGPVSADPCLPLCLSWCLPRAPSWRPSASCLRASALALHIPRCPHSPCLCFTQVSL